MLACVGYQKGPFGSCSETGMFSIEEVMLEISEGFLCFFSVFFPKQCGHIEGVLAIRVVQSRWSDTGPAFFY